MSNTICENCYFAQKANSDVPCFFGIPELIKNNYTTEVYNDYLKIQNYNCRYGFSKKTYQENIDKFHTIDMVEYIKQNNIVRYALALIVKDNVLSVVEKIDKLSIKPYYITIVCYNKDGKILHDALLNREPYIHYKVHNFLENIPSPQALHVALETNKTKIGNLLWILTEDGLDNCVYNDSIQNINYNINVLQNPAHYYKCSSIDSQFDGIFINTNNYWNLSRTHNYEIENNSNILISYYD